MSTSYVTNLLLLGSLADPLSERGVTCAGDIPEASDPEPLTRARLARKALGDRAIILGHHYQRDEVIEFADITGDSFKLAQAAQQQESAEFVIFCGVHFMAESADILTSDKQQVILPDLAAGCSMADMATASQVDACWSALTDIGVAAQTIPVTYMNSSAAIKSFTGEHGGTICTSSNARLRWNGHLPKVPKYFSCQINIWAEIPPFKIWVSHLKTAFCGIPGKRWAVSRARSWSAQR